METTTFTCTKSAEELSKSARERKLTFTIVSWACIIAMPALCYMIFWGSGTFIFTAFSLMLCIIGVAIMIMCFFVFRKVLERLPEKYAIMPTKEFSWDEQRKQFTYKDKDQTLRFKSDDIEKWVSYVNNKSQESTEIIHLLTGEKIILEGEWNAEVHNYLNNNRNSLGLPQPKRLTLSSDIY